MCHQDVERLDTQLHCRNLVIERIASSAVIRPKRYIQAQDEWVLLLPGTADIEIDGKTESRHSGDLFFCQPTHRIS